MNEITTSNAPHSHRNDKKSLCKTQVSGAAASCSLAFNGPTVDVCNGSTILPPSLCPQLARATLPRNDKFSSRFTLHSLLRRKAAFTLAEVLITLGIIGIVAALTIPSKISNYDEKRTVVQLKSAYSLISQAVLSAVAENGDVSNWCSSPMTDYGECSNKIYKTLVPYFKSPILCTAVRGDKRCGPDQYNAPDGSLVSVPTTRRILTNSRIMLAPEAMSGDRYANRWCTSTVAEAAGDVNKSYFNYCAYIYVDINGPSGPNEPGRDLFMFKLFKDGVRPGGVPDDDVYMESFDNRCLSKNLNNGIGRMWCTGWVMYNENMDYLHCDDLSWDGKKNCSSK